MTKSVFSLLLCLSVCISALGQQVPEPVGEVRKIADGFRFAEGPAWNGTDTLFFSDMPANAIHRWSESEGVRPVRKAEFNSNGIVVDGKGDLLFCAGDRRIVLRSPDGLEQTLADACDGQPLGIPNDLWLAPDGGVYFTIPMIRPSHADRLPENAVNATVCRISPDRNSIRNVGYGLKNANGIVGSRDGKRLYVADPRSQKCFLYSIDADGYLSNQQVAAARASDGLTLDEYGNLYTTSHEGVRVFSPAGIEIARVPTPEPPANMTFGGKDGRTLFITARTSVYAVSMNVRGDFYQAPQTDAPQ